jgi:hypothetical protein
MRPEIRWGLILAACLCIWTLLLHVTGVYTVHLQYASWADNAAIVFPLVALIGAMLERRRRQSGWLTMRDGFLTGVATMLISWPITAAFMLLYHHVIHPEWLERLTAFERQQLLSAGATQAAVASATARLAARAGVGYELWTSLIGTIVLGVVASAVIVLVLRRTSPRIAAATASVTDRSY